MAREWFSYWLTDILFLVVGFYAISDFRENYENYYRNWE